MPALEPIDLIREAAIPLPAALNLVRSLALGQSLKPLTGHVTNDESATSRMVALHLHFRASDASVRDLRGTVILPHRFLTTKTLVFAEGPLAAQAKKCGVEYVGGQELAELMLKTGGVPSDMDFQRVIATPDMMPHVTKLARILGPLGLMPTAKKGTISEDIEVTLNQQADAVMYKTDHNGYLSAILGKTDMPLPNIQENMVTFLEHLKEVKKGKKGRFVEKMLVQARDGPAILVEHKVFKM